MKETGSKVDCFIGFFHQPGKNLTIEKRVDLLTNATGFAKTLHLRTRIEIHFIAYLSYSFKSFLH